MIIQEGNLTLEGVTTQTKSKNKSKVVSQTVCHPKRDTNPRTRDLGLTDTNLQLR